MILLVVLHIYCWVEIALSDPRQVRQLPRGLWALVVFAPLVGPVAWLVFGRPNGTEVPAPAPRSRPRQLAPDDDVDFLRTLRRRPRPPEDSP
jgi:Phospholipase_D-nuclease N-terminal